MKTQAQHIINTMQLDVTALNTVLNLRNITTSEKQKELFSTILNILSTELPF